MQHRAQRKKLENELHSFSVQLYKNGRVLPNFAEAIRILYVHTKPLNDLFVETIGGSDILRRQRFESQLVLTGFTPDDQEAVELLSYEKRKQSAVEAHDKSDREFVAQRRMLDKLLRLLEGDTFKNIDKELIALHQLVDLCRFNFVAMLQPFDAHFSSMNISYQPSYEEVSLARLGNAIEDLYVQLAGLQINAAVAQAVIALAQLRAGAPLTAERNDAYIENIKKIAYVITHILTQEHLLVLIRIFKEDASYNPKVVEYKESARINFATRLQQQYQADEQRIKAELKDMRLSDELSNLFGGENLVPLVGYDSAMNAKLRENTALAFMYITPLQILKTFLERYVTEPIQLLANNIVIEGFFNNPTYKTEFSTTVYAVCESLARIAAFENSFARGNQYDSAVLEGYIRDSHKDTSFYSKMETLVTTINVNAQKLMQEEINTLRSFYIQMDELLADAKKPQCEIISNLKVLLLSSRNRDSTDLLEQQMASWEIFFEIMKNYTIIKRKAN